MEIVKEHFKSIHQLLGVLNSRPNNSVMANEDSSQSGSYDFTGSHSYEEAVQLFREGYKEILPKIMSKMKRMEKDLSSEFQFTKKIRPQNSIEGVVPNVPNAILGLPQSMIDMKRFPQKQKTLNIIYEMGANCGTNKELFINAGVVLLTAIKILETRRISVKLTLGFMAGKANKQGNFPTVDLKDYGQRLDLQKLCFPLAHPSMFRRIGFKWLETNPDITDKDFRFGYGRSPADETKEWKDFVNQLNLPKNARVLRAQDIDQMKFDVGKLIDYLNINNAQN